MGIHYASLAGKVPTAEERALLSDATIEPAVPGSVSSLRFVPFSVVLYPSGAPTTADVNQHAIGDCSAASVLASLAMQAPAFLQRVIDDHHDGSFGVHMYDPAGRAIVVNVSSQFLSSGGSLQAVSAKDGSADWATVLEKAAIKYRQVYPVVGNIGGIGSEFASPMFTGSGDSYAYYPGALSSAEFTSVVKTELARGKLLIGGFNRETSIGNVKTVTAHAYMIATPNSGAMVTMRNPWGVSPLSSGGYDSAHNGYVDVPATEDWSNTVDLRIIDPGAAR